MNLGKRPDPPSVEAFLLEENGALAQFIELDWGKGASISGLHPQRISIALTNATIFYYRVNVYIIGLTSSGITICIFQIEREGPAFLACSPCGSFMAVFDVPVGIAISHIQRGNPRMRQIAI